MFSEERIHLLKKHLISILNKKISLTDLADLITLSKIILIPFLLNTKSSFLKLSYIHGMGVNDLSIDILGNVFRGDGKIVYIENFAAKLYQDINTIDDVNLFLAYQSFLRTMANAHIANTYADLDPNGFKIQRNIKETLPTECLKLRKSILGVMIFVKGSEAYDNLPYLSIEEFEKDFLNQAYDLTTTRELLDVILSLLISNNHYRKEISLLDAVRLFKRHYKIDQVLANENEQTEILCGGTFVDKFEIDQLCSKVMEKMRGKIFIDYFSKGKLTLHQTKALDNAINDIVADLVNIGKNHLSYYDYLIRYIKLNHDEYELKFKSKVEYLVRQIKESFRNYFYSKD